MDDAALARIRERIDAVDAKLVELVAKRIAIVEEARALKAAHGVELYDRAREAALLDERTRWGRSSGIAEETIHAVFGALLDVSRGRR